MDSYSSEDDEDGFSRDQWILSHLNEKDLMKYLELEQKRAEMSQQEKKPDEKRNLHCIPANGFSCSRRCSYLFIKR